MIEDGGLSSSQFLGPEGSVGGPLDPLKPAADDGHIRIGTRNLDRGPLIDPLPP